MYYAVKKGNTTGIFETWAECQKQVKGYSGAVFKKFDDLQAAEHYLQADDSKPPLEKEGPFAYIDGSYNHAAGVYSYGGFIRDGNDTTLLQGVGNDPRYLKERNIAGEAMGVLQTMETALFLGLHEIILYYDYAGLEQWAAGNWKAKSPLATYYVQEYGRLKDFLTVHFVHVKGHTGNEGNELADILAKEAAGAKLRKKDLVLLETIKRQAGKAEQ